MLYLGLDQSLRSPGFALVDQDGKVVRSTVLSVGRTVRGAARLVHIARGLRAYVGTETIVGGAIEGPSLGSVHREFDLGEVSGVLRALALEAFDVDLLVVPPATLKKFVAGHGGADKDSMIYFVKSRWGVACADDNEADAVGLAQFARATHLHEFRTRAGAEAVLARARPKARRPRRSTTKAENI